MKNNDFTIEELIDLAFLVDAKIAYFRESIDAFKEYSKYSKSGDYSKGIAFYEKEISEYTVISEKIAYKKKNFIH